jgi:hypothetical protein
MFKQKRYLGNTNTLEVHDTNKEKGSYPFGFSSN